MRGRQPCLPTQILLHIPAEFESCEPSAMNCFAVLFSSITAHAQSAAEILAKVTSVYASCRTYSDEGSISVQGPGTGGRGTHFRTSFVRPSGFRFELWYPPDTVTPLVVVRNG